MLAAAPERIGAMSASARAVTQGHGAGYLATLMGMRGDGPVTFRPAELSDLELFFALRNAPENRVWFFKSGEVALGAHTRWFASRLESPDCEMFVAELAELPIAVVRFDFEGSVATTSIMLEPALHGRGLGAQVLNIGIAALSARRRTAAIVAEVKAGNTASLKLFGAAGFSVRSAGSTLIRLERTGP